MTNAEWEAANEDDSDRWMRHQAETGLQPPQNATLRPADNRTVWRDRGARIATLETRVTLLTRRLGEAQQNLHTVTQRALIAEDHLRKVALLAHEHEAWMNARVPAKDLDERDQHRGFVDEARAVLAPSPAATTGEAVSARHVTRGWLNAEVSFVYDRGGEDETPVLGRLSQITHYDTGVSLEVDRQDWDEDGECFTSQEWEIDLDELVTRPAPASSGEAATPPRGGW